MKIFKSVSVHLFYFFNLWIISVDSIDFNATVSLDGSKDFKSINDAIEAAPDNSITRFYIRVTAGTYNEHVQIPQSKTFIGLIGDDALSTIIVNDRSNGTGFGTSDSATLTVNGNNFMAESLSFENSAGPQNGQAVAVLDQADYTAYYKCRFVGFEDTVYVKGQPQFFKECDIYGTVDFIFGHGLVMFQDCNIYARLPRLITVTAQSKNEPQLKSGFSFQNCTVTVSSDIAAEKANVKVYLGRPWREFSRVVFMESYLDDMIAPEGWLEWPGVPVNNLFYAEFNNRGPGANVSMRVTWTGYHVIDKQLATQFTVDSFIDGSNWLPETGIPFRPTLIS